MDSDRIDQLARSQQARSTAAQLQSQLVAVARGLPTPTRKRPASTIGRQSIGGHPPTSTTW